MMKNSLAWFWLVGALTVGCALDETEVASSEHAVIGGEVTPEGLYPATGALRALGQFFCTGTLIAPDTVLTAAHCLDPFFLGDEIPGFTLALNANTPPAAEVVTGLSALQHPSFDIFANITPGIGQFFDIGLLRLAEPITDVPFGSLPSHTQVAGLIAGAELEIVGYGLVTVDGQAAGVKHHGVADLVQVGDFELLVAQPGQQQNCNGDSGGPAYLSVDGQLKVVGIVSRAPDDNAVCDHGGVDTRLDAYLDWVEQNVTLPCGSGSMEPCLVDEAPGGSCSVATGRGRSPGGGVAVGLGLVLAALWARRRRGASASR